jgi:CheY-like chemotaxis protein
VTAVLPEVLAALAGARVLLVEDNLVSQRLTSAILRKLGLVVEVAADGHAAVEQARVGRHDLIFMDCELPGMDGFAATRAIRGEEPPGRRVPVVAMTGAATPEDRARCLAAGMDEHVAKPVALAQLTSLLLRWLGAAPVSTPMWQELALELRPEELAELVALLRRQVSEGIAGMRVRLAANDVRGVGELAHALGGAAGNLGALPLATQLRAIEVACRSADAPPNEAAFTALEQALAEVGEFFRARLAR